MDKQQKQSNIKYLGVFKNQNGLSPTLTTLDQCLRLSSYIFLYSIWSKQMSAPCSRDLL